MRGWHHVGTVGWGVEGWRCLLGAELLKDKENYPEDVHSVEHYHHEGPYAQKVHKEVREKLGLPEHVTHQRRHYGYKPQQTAAPAYVVDPREGGPLHLEGHVAEGEDAHHA